MLDVFFTFLLLLLNIQQMFEKMIAMVVLFFEYCIANFLWNFLKFIIKKTCQNLWKND